MDFKYYQTVIDIDFLNDDGSLGNYHKTINNKMETRSIHSYKDAVWDVQGLINNSISIRQNFFINSHVTLYGVTYDNEFVILRHRHLEM